MEKVKLAAAALLFVACGNIEGLTKEDILGLRTSPNASLSGQVTHAATGAPVAGASLEVQGASTKTDENGAYRVEGLVGREARVSISAHGFHPFTLVVDLAPGGNTRNVALEPRSCGRTDCPAGTFCAGDTCVKGATLTGAVVSDCDGAPLDALVTVDSRSTCSTTSSGKAYFKLTELTPGGPHTLSIGKEGWQAFSTQLSLAPLFNAIDTVRLVPVGGCAAGTPANIPCTCTAPGCP